MVSTKWGMGRRKNAYDALVYNDGTTTIAVDGEGNEIASQAMSLNDDQIVIQAAYDAIPTYGLLRLAGDAFTITDQLVFDEVKDVLGVGARSTRILSVVTGGVPVILVNNGTTYIRNFEIGNFTLDGYSHTTGNSIGITLQYTQHVRLHDIYMKRFKVRGIELNRSYWCHLHDIYGSVMPADGVLVGKYSGGVDLYSNQNMLSNVHMEAEVAGVGTGFKINSGVNNKLINCDASGFDIGFHITADNAGMDATYRTHLIGPWTEGSTTGIKIERGLGTHGAGYTIVTGPNFGLFSTSMTDDTGNTEILGLNPYYLLKAKGSSTGTGSEQTIAHSLAAIPTGCKAWIKYLVGSRYVTEMIPFDATNVYPTVDSGTAFEWRIE